MRYYLAYLFGPKLFGPEALCSERAVSVCGQRDAFKPIPSFRSLRQLRILHGIDCPFFLWFEPPGDSALLVYI